MMRMQGGFIEDLAARRRFGMKPGLETIAALCRTLGEPQRALRAVHVAGTNGKGAVCAMLDASLRSAGFRVGRYTSPHLVSLNERFFLDGRPADDVRLERISSRVHGAMASAAPQDVAEVTFFEALTAVAFALYAEAGVDYAVLETGLGGRLDATNVCCPCLSVITRIGLDHCDWLGDTVEKIAAEKAGIVKPGVPVVLGRNADSVRAVVEARAKAVGAPFVYAPDVADESEISADFSLGGSFNRENAVTAIAALKTLLNCEALSPAVAAGFSRITWPGRFQRVGNFIVDGAHNPPAARALAQALAEQAKGLPDGRFTLIAGFCGDKDVDTVLRTLAPLVKKGLAVRTNNPRSLSAEEAAAKMRLAGIAAETSPSLAAAIEQAKRSNDRTVVCGSLFLAGEALVELGAYPWGETPRFDPSEKLRTAT